MIMVPGYLPRRTLLREAGTLSAVATLATLAGCSSTNDAETDDGPAQSFHRWLHAPGAMTHKEHYTFSSLKPGQIEEHAGQLREETLAGMRANEQRWQPTGVEFGDAERVLSLEASNVVIAAFDRTSVVGALRDAGYERSTDGDEFDVYAGGDHAVGVGDGTLVFGTETLDVDAVTAAQKTIDVWRGDAERYPGTNEDLAVLLERLGDGTLLTGRTTGDSSGGDRTRQLMEGDVRASGTRIRFDGATSEYLEAFVFAGTAQESDLEGYLDALPERSPGSKLTEREFRTDGRVGLVEGTLDTADL